MTPTELYNLLIPLGFVETDRATYNGFSSEESSWVDVTHILLEMCVTIFVVGESYVYIKGNADSRSGTREETYAHIKEYLNGT